MFCFSDQKPHARNFPRPDLHVDKSEPQGALQKPCIVRSNLTILRAEGLCINYHPGDGITFSKGGRPSI